MARKSDTPALNPASTLYPDWVAKQLREKSWIMNLPEHARTFYAKFGVSNGKCAGCKFLDSVTTGSGPRSRTMRVCSKSSSFEKYAPKAWDPDWSACGQFQAIDKEKKARK